MAASRLEVLGVEGVPEIRPGDDLAAALADPLRRLGPRESDVLVVTQKIVSKAEGRLVPDDGGRETWVAREARRIVARRRDLVIAETRHGFVCANAGVDASNVPRGFLSLLPEDPDGSAERIREGLAARLGVAPAVVVTDTFGRPWRRGLVNVAIGCAGLPALVDLRGTPDHEGRLLEATVVALADEVAAASGLVMGKAARVPAALVRGLDAKGPPGRAADLVRPPEEDLFRESPLQAIGARRTIRSFGPGEVPREAVEEAVRAACTAPAPHHTRPWLFVALASAPARRTYLSAMADAWRRDLEADATPTEVIARRLARSEALLGRAPLLVVPAIRLRGAHAYPDPRRSRAERDMFVLSAGAAIQNLLLALHAQGLASCWISSSLFCGEEVRAALGLEPGWEPMGTVAVGRPPAGEPPPRPPLDLGEHLRTA
ncbi:MAG TPA: coenzyme F420-0:L-glutamate ligase [Actinomycetota bacterium]|nr:coenzyme F420-0:L-glutamate ligase [Actinomycetota bacterium]